MRPIFSRGNSDDPGMEASEPLQFLWVALSSDGVGIHRWNWGGGGRTIEWHLGRPMVLKCALDTGMTPDDHR
jgi:hypothetical protein